MRDVHESWDADLRRDLCDALCALRMYGVVGEVPAEGVRGPGMWADGNALGLVFTTDEVVDNVRVSQALLNLVLVAKVPFLIVLLVKRL